VNFEEEHLVENVATVFRELLALRPKGKGAPNASKYVRKAYLSSTMGKGSARLEVSDLVDAASALK
jgi:ribosomal protein L1